MSRKDPMYDDDNQLTDVEPFDNVMITSEMKQEAIARMNRPLREKCAGLFTEAELSSDEACAKAYADYLKKTLKSDDCLDVTEKMEMSMSSSRKRRSQMCNHKTLREKCEETNVSKRTKLNALAKAIRDTTVMGPYDEVWIEDDTVWLSIS